MKNLLALTGLIFIGYVIYTHPTTKNVSKCISKQIPNTTTDDVIDNVTKKVKKNLTK